MGVKSFSSQEASPDGMNIEQVWNFSLEKNPYVYVNFLHVYVTVKNRNGYLNMRLIIYSIYSLIIYLQRRVLLFLQIIHGYVMLFHD